MTTKPDDKTDTHTPQIIGQLLRASEEIGTIDKTGKNAQQQYSFRGIDHIVNHAAPAFRKHGIIVTPHVHDVTDTPVVSGSGTKGWRVTMLVDYTFHSAIDGSEVSATTRGEGQDYSDKASNKAMSQAYKYALTEALTLPTGEADGDADTPTQRPAAATSTRPATATARPVSARPAAAEVPAVETAPAVVETIEYPNLAIGKLDKDPTGWWPQVCPYCTSPVKQKTITTKRGESEVFQCSSYDCEHGQPKKDGDGFWPWSTFESDEGMWGPGGWVDQNLTEAAIADDEAPF